MNHGLKPETLAQIVAVLSRFPRVEGAILFGSRTKGTHKPGSDIDLALFGNALDWPALGRIDDTLDELLLPYRFSLLIYDGKTDPGVAAHIARVGVPFYGTDGVPQVAAQIAVHSRWCEGEA